MGSANQRRQAGFRNNVPAVTFDPVNYGHTISTNEELIKDCIQDSLSTVFNNSKIPPHRP